jgi:nicotinamide riboside kinase
MSETHCTPLKEAAQWDTIDTMRIAVIGPQNTGKSTFIKDFLAAFPSYTTPEETYRDVVHKKGLSINQNTSEESQRMIRDFLAEQLAHFPGENVIFDRCVIDNYVYTKAKCDDGHIRSEFLEETDQILRASLVHLDALIFIPTAAGVAFVDDELRDTDRTFADRINTLFIELLLELRPAVPHRIITVSGPREVRIARVRESIDI